MVLCQQGVSRGFIQQGVSRGFMPGVFNCTHSRVKNTQDDTRGGNGKFEEESHVRSCVGEARDSSSLGTRLVLCSLIILRFVNTQK